MHGQQNIKITSICNYKS